MNSPRFNLMLLFSFTAAALRLGAQTSSNEASTLMDLDRAFDAATAARGVDGWVAYFAPNGSMVGDTARPVTGPAEIREAMKGFFGDPSASLRWKPTRAEITIPGVVGYTVGTFERRRKSKDGKMTVATGRYTTLWKKQPDGFWRIILDTGALDGPPVEIK